MKRKLIRFLRTGLLDVLCLMLFCNLWQIAARKLFHQELPYILGYARLTVLSGSMEPAFSAGDWIVIHREDSYQVGDCISFWEDGSLMTHRIIARGPEGFTTKGDFNNVQDTRPVLADQIAGRVVLVIPSAGRLFLFWRSPWGMPVISALGLLLLFLPDVCGRVRYKRKG